MMVNVVERRNQLTKDVKKLIVVQKKNSFSALSLVYLFEKEKKLNLIDFKNHTDGTHLTLYTKNYLLFLNYLFSKSRFSLILICKNYLHLLFLFLLIVLEEEKTNLFSILLFQALVLF